MVGGKYLPVGPRGALGDGGGAFGLGGAGGIGGLGAEGGCGGVPNDTGTQVRWVMDSRSSIPPSVSPKKPSPPPDAPVAYITKPHLLSVAPNSKDTRSFRFLVLPASVLPSVLSSVRTTSPPPENPSTQKQSAPLSSAMFSQHASLSNSSRNAFGDESRVPHANRTSHPDSRSVARASGRHTFWIIREVSVEVDCVVVSPTPVGVGVGDDGGNGGRYIFAGDAGYGGYGGQGL